MNRHALAILLWTFAVLLSFAAPAAEYEVILPKRGLEPHEIGVVANTSDPDSLAVAEYYLKARRIPGENLVRVAFDPEGDVMAPPEFQKIKSLVDAGLPGEVQALALAWSRPFRVGCMSVTSAFAFGFDRAYCAKGPELTRRNDYFASESRAPYSDFGIRPSMLLAGESVEQVKAMIDRGEASDGTRPQGTAYLVKTGDKNRDVRAKFFDSVVEAFGGFFNVIRVDSPGVRDMRDVMFYFTGTKQVPYLETLTFLPGAAADHLTSGGGKLFGGRQMSVLEWLKAGATGSYGTVVEPYNIPGKFPHPGVLMDHYMRGETLIEAYWKSVAMPGQGVFVGEPLARPFGGAEVGTDGGRLTIRTMALSPGEYALLWSRDGLPPYYLAEDNILIDRGLNSVTITRAAPGYYFFERR